MLPLVGSATPASPRISAPVELAGIPRPALCPICTHRLSSHGIQGCRRCRCTERTQPHTNRRASRATG